MVARSPNPSAQSPAPSPAPLPAGPRGEPLWIAAGAAVVGVLFGGAAVFLGVQTRPTGPAPVVAADPLAELPELPAATPEPAATPTPALRSGDALVEAVAATRSVVVTLRSKDTIGAGVVVDDSGLVLTNFHVVAGAIRDPARRVLGRSSEAIEEDMVRARFVDGRELPAALLVADRDQDIALLRLRPADSAERFAAAKLGRSASLRVGEGVFAVGTPLGLDHSVSQGIVAALGRTGILRSRQTPLVQLDASINVGNSGGPLFNLRGELVGITTATAERAHGIGFAIPVDHIFALLRALREGASARSGQIGVEVDPRVPISDEATRLGYANGLVLQQVVAEQPAAKAGLLAGDVIVEARGQRFDRHGAGEDARIRLAREFVTMVRGLIPGEPLSLTVLRGATKLPVIVEVAAAPEDRQVFIDAEELLGLHVEEKASRPVVVSLRPLAPITGWRGRERLIGARIAQIAGMKVDDMAAMRQVLTQLRQVGRSGTVAITFALTDGQELGISDYPVSEP